MTVTVVDSDERRLALDPVTSFCVSAPAGSGKTELLIQRYLTLLARVESPEQVLAITFTRKAAAEMRDRVLEALHEATLGSPCESPHEQSTRDLALAALAADQQRGWQLQHNISRLNIKTIDSFCGQLTRQMPILSEFGGQATVVDNADDLYMDAVSELFKLIDTENELRQDLVALMLHFDNDWSRLGGLLSKMLAMRDQWRPYMGVHHHAGDAEAYLRKTVQGLVAETLDALEYKLRPYSNQLLALQCYSAQNLDISSPERFPSATVGDLALWRTLRSMLLTADKNGKWRASITVKNGFPAGKGEPAARKAELLELIAELSELPGLREELNAVMSLPDIASNTASWQLVLHLSRILPLLAAQLLLVFQSHGKVDHSQIALSALQALGEDEMPTELAMRMDYQLEHILVDEFQDTAFNQFELVRRLTRGWAEHNEAQPEAPRTLFIVGDGMQSIYGFRNANVGLFLKARSEGFNGVRLTALGLRSNFRSEAGVVDWVNDTFAQAFPSVDNVSRSEIAYTPATAVRGRAEAAAVHLSGFSGEQAADQELDDLCHRVEEGVADPDVNSIAILARTRSHLQPILSRFKHMGIVYSAQDIDRLSQSSVIVDLVSLCRALVSPADRVAWLAILRAPWCGLSLADLHVIGTAGDSPEFTSIATVLADTRSINALSAEGCERSHHVYLAMQGAMALRDRLPLRAWIENLWLGLGGATSITKDSQLQDAERFFQLLEEMDQQGLGFDLPWLQTRLESLYVQAESPDSKVQVMTLHKAKGLEFDWVMIPQLHKTPRSDSRPLLLWDDHSSATGERGFILAADDHSREGEPTLYNWLKLQRRNKQRLEVTRLLYVGCTRAVKQLFLSANVTRDKKSGEFRPPAASTLLASIWPVIEQLMTVKDTDPSASSADLANPGVALQRLDQSTVKSLMIDSNALEAAPDTRTNVPEQGLNRADRYIGTVVHKALEQLSQLPELPTGISEQHRRYWRVLLADHGLFGDELSQATVRVESSITATLEDSVGRWLLSSAHPQAESELPLTHLDSEGRVRDIVIDRTFIDREAGTRWVIDYKNSLPHSEETVEVFAAREAGQYRGQLETYRDAMGLLGPEPISCALYFPALGYFQTVTF